MFTFGTSKTYSDDLELFRKIKLTPFEINDQKLHYLGKYKLPNYEKATIKISVICMPAQFWKLEIITNEQNIFIMETGSGALSQYFHFAELVAEGMIEMKKVTRPFALIKSKSKNRYSNKCTKFKR